MTLGRFDLYRVNPPLVRTVAAIPVVALGAETDWRNYRVDSYSRSEFAVGRDFVLTNPERFPWYFTVARWSCIPFSLIGALICFSWASRLYGPTAGLVALALWCFCPNVIGHGQLVTPDVAAASLGVAAGYAFWRWLKGPTWESAAAAGFVMGLAELTKSTWVLLFLLWPALVVVWRLTRPAGQTLTGRFQAVQLVSILTLGLIVLNLGYGFEGSFNRLGDFQFISHALRGSAPHDVGTKTVGNVFSGTWLGSIPLPFPKNYVQGIDSQKWDFDKTEWSYLRGQWRKGGWYHYYLYAMLIKVPLGTWCIGLLALVVSIAPSKWLHSRLKSGGASESARDDVASQPSVGSNWRDEIVLLAPAIVTLALVSFQTGFNHHVRYVLPAFPFFFVWGSKVGKFVSLGSSGGSVVHRETAPGVLGILVSVALAWSIVSSLSIYPHGIGYFNELVRGSREGHLHMGVSNTDWGEDLWFLKSWYDAHPEARPLHLAYYLSLVDPKVVGIEYVPVEYGPIMNRVGKPKTPNWPWEEGEPIDLSPYEANFTDPGRPLGPLPGWYILSVNMIHRPHGRYEYFQEFEPIDRIGYSMNVYHITRDEANRVRQKLGLSMLSGEVSNESP